MNRFSTFCPIQAHRANEHLSEASTSQESSWGPLGVSILELPKQAHASQPLTISVKLCCSQFAHYRMELTLPIPPTVAKGTMRKCFRQSLCVECGRALLEATFQQKVQRLCRCWATLGNQMLIRERVNCLKSFWEQGNVSIHLRALKLASEKTLRQHSEMFITQSRKLALRR